MERMNRSLSLLVFLGSFAAIIPSLHADIGEFDEYWKKREEVAREVAYKSYNPDPFNVTNSFNYQVSKATIGANDTRRSMLRVRRKGGGPCKATNPIDRCWRCDPNWANNRKKLASCVIGFGHKTTGGKDGKIYVVTDPSDNDMVNPKPGTLRHAVIQKEPLWIIFARSMIIRLNQELLIASHKTIDARGHFVHISGGAGLTLQFVQNVIIHGLRIHHIVKGSGGLIRDSVNHYGFRTQSDGDGISMFGSSNIWIDHVSMSRCQDGLVDAIMGSTSITISNSHFTHHNDVMLFGANDAYVQENIMQITVAFNHFGKGLVQRMPRCRRGFFHVVNNDYTHWQMYAIGGSEHPTIISQGNRFIAPDRQFSKEVTKRVLTSQASKKNGASNWKTWNWRSEGDLMMNGAFFVESGKPITHKYTKLQIIKSKPGTFATRLTRYSGSLDCFIGKPC